MRLQFLELLRLIQVPAEPRADGRVAEVAARYRFDDSFDPRRSTQPFEQ